MEGCGQSRLEDACRRLVKLTERNRILEDQWAATRGALRQAHKRIAALEQQVQQANAKTDEVQAQLQELKDSLRDSLKAQSPAPSSSQSGVLPDFIKANVPQGPPRPAGQKPGHRAAHRPFPLAIDVHVDVPVPTDRLGQASCPACQVQLQDVKTHQRVVEDMLPARRVVTCYHTTSGYCPGCRKRIESRDNNQPPAPAGVELHQPQLGLNALASVGLLRLRYRLPFRQIEQLFLDLPGMSLSPGAVVKQMQRMAGWLEAQYDRLKVLIHASPSVHMDETSWRVGGQNQWLWTMLCQQATVFHMDPSRSGQVAGKLLGRHYSGTLVSDFYGAYGQVECGKQKCLVHLLRELKETAQKHPGFGQGAFARRLGRLVHEMLLLKKKKNQKEPQFQAGVYEARYEARVRRLERRLLELEQPPPGGWRDPAEKRLARRLQRHRGELTVFLRKDEVEGTNNAAERGLRPAVVARKISGGSRSQAGAKATAVLMSVLRTAMQQQCPLFETLKTLLTAHWSGQNPALLTDVFNEPN